MPEVGSTQFVETDADGAYTRPEGPQTRIRDLLAKRLGRVDANGFRIATPDPTVVDTVTAPTSPPPSMATALLTAADAMGADLEELLQSRSFRQAVATISPANQTELQEAIADHMAAPTAPTMKPNPAQGAPSASAPGPATGTTLDRIHAQTAKHLDQPLPPGSTVL